MIKYFLISMSTLTGWLQYHSLAALSHCLFKIIEFPNTEQWWHTKLYVTSAIGETPLAILGIIISNQTAATIGQTALNKTQYRHPSAMELSILIGWTLETTIKSRNSVLPLYIGAKWSDWLTQERQQSTHPYTYGVVIYPVDNLAAAVVELI